MIKESRYYVYCVGTLIKDYFNKPIDTISVSGNCLTEQKEKGLNTIVLASSRRLSRHLGHVSYLYADIINAGTVCKI